MLSVSSSSAQLALHSCHKQHIPRSPETGVSFRDATSHLSSASAFFHSVRVLGGQIVEQDLPAVEARGGSFPRLEIPSGVWMDS